MSILPQDRGPEDTGGGVVVPVLVVGVVAVGVAVTVRTTVGVLVTVVVLVPPPQPASRAAAASGRTARRITSARRLVAAGRARAVQHDVVVADVEAHPPREAVDRRLQPSVLERGDPPTGIADEMVVVHPAGEDGLVAGGVLADLQARDEVKLRQLLERAVDAGPSHGAALAAQSLVDLVRGQRARLAAEQIDHGPPGPASAEAGMREAGLRVVHPLGVLDLNHGQKRYAVSTTWRRGPRGTERPSPRRSKRRPRYWRSRRGTGRRCRPRRRAPRTGPSSVQPGGQAGERWPRARSAPPPRAGSRGPARRRGSPSRSGRAAPCPRSRAPPRASASSPGRTPPRGAGRGAVVAPPARAR